MSNLYVTEPATSGKVIVETTIGEIEIELFAKETPKACRNFIALIMEGYYDNVIFHRVVPGFIVQTGDPSGTGMGGESVYGEPFENEIHSRLKFNRRGLVAMANNGDKTSNTSQWFITLDRADELQGKNTLFGKITGPTIYNVLKVDQLELDKQERPLFPPKITSIRIIDNPFPDIIPRITASERKAQREARIEAARERELRENKKKAKKNTGLLSFGEDADSGEAIAVKKKAMTRPDLIDPDESVAPAQQYVGLPASLANIGRPREEEERAKKRKASEAGEGAEDLASIRAQAAAAEASSAQERQAAIDRMQARLRKLDKKRAGSDASDSESDADERPTKKRSGPSFLDQELAKYSSARRTKGKRGKRDEEDVLSALSSFAGKIRQAEGGEEGDAKAEEELEVDDDVDWIGHTLKAAKDDGSESRRAESDYTVIDPRAKARALQSERREANNSSGSRRR